jgi:hypothetical protein
MASAMVQKKPCSKCGKGTGIFTCDGCQQSFCRKHSEEHRQELTIQMDNIGQEHDVLHREADKENNSHPLLSHINVWERESINKIEQVAEQARVDLKQLIDQRKQEFKTTMNRLTDELQSSRESEDYTELDLNRWTNQLNELRQNLEKSMTTNLINEDDGRSVIRFIKVSSAQQYDHEKFNNGDKEIILSEDELVATYSGGKIKRSPIVFGTCLYATGTHQIHFRIEKMTNENFYFGIVTFSQMDCALVYSSQTTVNGWWRCNYAVVHGKVEGTMSSIKILEHDEITLTLNCDNKQISLNHHRTKEMLQLPIDVKRCPLPWKLIVGIASIGNCVRILH